MSLISFKIKDVLPRFEDRPYFALGVLLVISFVIKAILVFQSEIINPDGIRYINSAHELFQGNISAAFANEKMLGFTFLLGLTHSIIHDWYLAGKILSSVALILTTIPLYFIALELFGRRAAFYTALVFTVAPVVNGKCKSVIKDPVFLLLVVTSLCLLIYGLREIRLSFAAVSGALASLSILIRPEGVVFLLIVSIFLCVLIVIQRTSRRSKIRFLAAFCSLPLGLLFFAAITLATGIVSVEKLDLLHLRFAHYFQTDFLRSYSSIYQHLKAVEESFPGGQWANDYFEFARKYLLLIYFVGIVQIFFESISPFFMIPLFFGLNLKRVSSRALFLLLSVLSGFLLMDFFFIVTRNFISSRYMLLPVVLTFTMIGYGVDRMVTALQNTRFKDYVFGVAIVICLILPVALTFYKSSDEKYEIKQAGIWLRENRNLSQTKIIVTEERIAYYAGLFRNSYKNISAANLNKLKNIALKEGYETIVVYRTENDMVENPVLEEFFPVEAFEGSKKVATIYERKKNG